MTEPNRQLLMTLRKEAKLTRTELGAAVGSSYSHIYNVECGFADISEDLLIKVADVLSKRLKRKIRVTQLVGGDPKPADPTPAKERPAPPSHPPTPRPVAPPRPSGPRRSATAVADGATW